MRHGVRTLLWPADYCGLNAELFSIWPDDSQIKKGRSKGNPAKIPKAAKNFPVRSLKTNFPEKELLISRL